MNNLDITKELKQVNFKYVSSNLTFEGTCEVTTEKKVQNISTQVSVKDNDTDIGIGSATSNGSISVNIWNSEYKSMIDKVAAALKALALDLFNYFNVQSNTQTV